MGCAEDEHVPDAFGRAVFAFYFGGFVGDTDLRIMLDSCTVTGAYGSPWLGMGIQKFIGIERDGPRYLPINDSRKSTLSLISSIAGTISCCRQSRASGHLLMMWASSGTFLEEPVGTLLSVPASRPSLGSFVLGGAERT